MKNNFFVALMLLAGSFGFSAELPKLPSGKDDAALYYHLGLNFYHGLGDKPNYPRAVAQFQSAAGLGHAQAQGMLGQCYLKGRGVKRDPRKAADWLTRAALQDDKIAQFNLGTLYTAGEGIAHNPTVAYRWYLKAAAQGHTAAMANIGVLHETGQGVKKDFTQAFKWYEMAAKPGLPTAQCNLGQLYATGRGVKANPAKAAEWYLKAAKQGYAQAQFLLSTALYFGNGVKQDLAGSYQWISLAAAQDYPGARQHQRTIGNKLTPEQFKTANEGVRDFSAKQHGKTINPAGSEARTGTGFFVTAEGHLLTSYHLIADAKRIEVRTSAAKHIARVVKIDSANGLALLHIKARSTPLRLGISHAVALGEPVFTIGFPKNGVQGIEPRLADGKVSRLLGAQDDQRFYQVSMPVQPGNSGGALVNDAGLAIGMVTIRLDDLKALKLTGRLPGNTNHALKGTQLATFLAGIPEARAKILLKPTGKSTYQEAIATAQAATVMILVHP
jgi:TPR repeat protein